MLLWFTEWEYRMLDVVLNAIKKNWFIILLCLILILCIVVTVWAVWFRGADHRVLNPDYAPPDEDENATVIPGDSNEKFETEVGGGAIRIWYSEDVRIDISEKTVALFYANPGKSTQNVVLQLVVQDELVAQSGHIKPGYQLTELQLLDGAEKMLREGIYVDAVLRVLCYDPITAEKAMVNTDAKITVTVHN